MKINRFLSGTFSTENQYKIFNWIYSTFWTCDFALKTNTNRFIENQLIFFSSIFVLKINTNVSLIKTLSCIRICRSKIIFDWFCYIFEIAILYWKSMNIFLLKIKWFSSFKDYRIPFTFYIGIFKYIFLLILLYFQNCHFCLLKINWFASFKNIRISLYFLYRDFQISFSNDFAILLR